MNVDYKGHSVRVEATRKGYIYSRPPPTILYECKQGVAHEQECDCVMQESQDYISKDNIEANGSETMNTPTNSRAVNAWLAKTGKTLDDLPESLRGLLTRGVDQ